MNVYSNSVKPWKGLHAPTQCFERLTLPAVSGSFRKRPKNLVSIVSVENFGMYIQCRKAPMGFNPWKRWGLSSISAQTVDDGIKIKVHNCQVLAGGGNQIVQDSLPEETKPSTATTHRSCLVDISSNGSDAIFWLTSGGFIRKGYSSTAVVDSAMMGLLNPSPFRTRRDIPKSSDQYLIGKLIRKEIVACRLS